MTEPSCAVQLLKEPSKTRSASFQAICTCVRWSWCLVHRSRLKRVQAVIATDATISFEETSIKVKMVPALLELNSTTGMAFLVATGLQSKHVPRNSPLTTTPGHWAEQEGIDARSTSTWTVIFFESSRLCCPQPWAQPTCRDNVLLHVNGWLRFKEVAAFATVKLAVARACRGPSKPSKAVAWASLADCFLNQRRFDGILEIRHTQAAFWLTLVAQSLPGHFCRYTHSLSRASNLPQHGPAVGCCCRGQQRAKKMLRCSPIHTTRCLDPHAGKRAMSWFLP